MSNGAYIVQGEKEANVPAERNLEAFLSKRRAKMLGFTFPENFEQINVNGRQATGWDQFIGAGDRVILYPGSGGVPEDAIGAESIGTEVQPTGENTTGDTAEATPTTPTTPEPTRGETPQPEPDIEAMQAKIAELRQERNNLREVVKSLREGDQSLEAINAKIRNYRNAMETKLSQLRDHVSMTLGGMVDELYNRNQEPESTMRVVSNNLNRLYDIQIPE